VADYDIPTPMRTFRVDPQPTSIACARDILMRERRLFEDSLAQVRAIPIRFPSGEVFSTVVLIAQELEDRPSWGVGLPTSHSFTGRIAGGQTETFDISILDYAWADGDCIVELTDGTRLEGVQVIPARICEQLTPLQKRIVYWTLKRIDAEAGCFGFGEPNPELEGISPSDSASRLRGPVPLRANARTQQTWRFRRPQSLARLAGLRLGPLSYANLRRLRANGRADSWVTQSLLPHRSKRLFSFSH
jgi:hypothetical protein